MLTSLGHWPIGCRHNKYGTIHLRRTGNHILNVDGTIGILMVDMWRALGYDEEEINEFIASGTL
ncbi:MAG TPA: hypothetical protein EYP59_09965, partial [Thiotrichaceae bacterium]|nr:hypothetical protein [Thiotrichaceae bacterium]